MDTREAEAIKVYFDAVAPAFASDARYPVFIEIAEDRVDKGYFGKSWTKAMAYMTAHLMEMSNRSGADASPAISRREGDIQVSYAASQQNDADLYMTSYGKMFLALLTQLSPGFVLSGGCIPEVKAWGHC